jgi:predicted GNAT family acetyltransferase
MVTGNASVMVAFIRDHKPSWTRVHCNAHWFQLIIASGLEGTYKTEMVEEVATRVWKGKCPEAINKLVCKMKHLSAIYKNNQSADVRLLSSRLSRRRICM